ncbi:MAG: hypothetical protein B5M53_06725 [Candidatus Cloacimonas sp. 4484_209]|nr:MAG: hypothetical protein B5M53_06725 [Candidatus Cloacimonas sp. 4484_209]
MNNKLIDKLRKKKIKGYLTIKERIVYPGAIYHITQRAPGTDILFLEDSDYLRFISFMRIISKKFQIEIFAFALMPNHIHLLLTIREDNLSEAMMVLFGNYAKYFNLKYKRKGHVFCGRFRSSLCNDDSYLIAASLYIHLNPIRAGISKSIYDYKWTSISLYTGNEKKSFIDYKTILLLLSPNIKEAKQKYLELLISGKNTDLRKFSGKDLAAMFIEHLKDITNKFNGNLSDLDRMIEKFKNKKRIVKPEEKKARKYLIEQLLSRGYSNKEITKLLNISRQTLNILKTP